MCINVAWTKYKGEQKMKNFLKLIEIIVSIPFVIIGFLFSQIIYKPFLGGIKLYQEYLNMLER